jgi:toxin ParE1/3/4
MILPLIVHPDVLVDIATARRWYEQVSLSLADEFSRCLAATLDGIHRNPRIYAVIEGSLRRANLHRFPYQVYYRITSRHVCVLGVYHSHTDPETALLRVSSRD